jgi:hypothetical protein
MFYWKFSHQIFDINMENSSPPQCSPSHGSELLIPALFALGELRVQWLGSQRQGSIGAL